MNLFESNLRTTFSEIDFWPVIEIFDDFILGRNIKRTMHHLRYDGYLMSKPFIDRLRMFQYQPMNLKSIKVEIGRRIPAFYLKEDYAVFGHVFLNHGSGQHMHPVFASVLKNDKGQSKYIIDGNQNTIVFVNPGRQEDILN